MATGNYALITGASSGIGTAFARHAASQGWSVGLTARRTDRLEALADEIRLAFGVEADCFPRDLSEPRSAEALIESVAQAGRTVNCLVNNAGYSIPQCFTGVSLADHRAFLELTVATPVALAHGVLPAMIDSGRGRIINISSITALSSGGKGHTLYPAGKAFLVKFSQSLSAELREKGIHATAVLPGFVETEFQTANGMNDKMQGAPRRFAQQPEDIAREAWRRNDEGAEIVVPGLLPKAAALCLQYLPEPLVRALTRRAAEKYYVGD